MKTTRRHELKENDLAHFIDTTRVYLGENGTKIGVVILVAIGAIAVVSITVGTRATNIEDAWRRKGQLVFDSPDEGKRSIDRLAAMIQESTDDNFALSGLMEQGLAALRLAQEVDAPPDLDLNAKARTAFEALLARFQNNPLAFGVAHTGLATVEENQFALDSDMAHKELARAHLQSVLDNPGLGSMPLYRLASDRLEKLDAVFTAVRFAPALEPVEPEPVAIEPVVVPVDELPEELQEIAAPADDNVDLVDTP